MDVTDLELCEYLQVRHAKVEAEDSNTSPRSSAQSQQQQQQQRRTTLPSKFYKHWTSLWVVLHVEVSPNYSYIGYCKKESDWLADSQTIAKCYLDETFKVERPPPGYSKKYENVLQLTFKGYRLDLGFESMTKLDQWLRSLQVTSERHHVDLVRCHEHPQLEGEYVVQISHSSYLVWNPSLKPCLRPQWEWHLKHIRRVHWHKNVNKLEVEPGRSSETGEGHFYFTGQHAFRLFQGMKLMMSTHSQVSSSPLPPRSDLPNGLVRTRGGGEGSGSESDWTGTGDDWTGASSDSAFINYIRSQHQIHRSPRVSPSPPLPPSQEGIYTGLNTQTLNQDNQYCTIERLQPVAGNNTQNHAPNRTTPTTNHTPIRMAPPTTTTSPLDSVAELGESLEEDEYCKMVPNAGIRAGLMRREMVSPLAANRPPVPPLRTSPSDPTIPTNHHPHHGLPTHRPLTSAPSDPGLRRPELGNSSPYRRPIPIQAHGSAAAGYNV